MYYIGLMSGTSMDAIDAALVNFGAGSDFALGDSALGDTASGDSASAGAAGLKVMDYRQYPIDPALRARARALDMSASIEEVSELDAIMGQRFADAALRILERNRLDKSAVAAIGSHGQTVLHLPRARHPRTWQIGDGNIIARRSGIVTATDFRRADMAVSGQGAPLAPAFHAWYFGGGDKKTAVLNLGGIANLSVLYREPVVGFDAGPGNGLLDQWTQHHRRGDYDEDGRWALSGRCHEELLRRMLRYRYFALPPPKSTGRDEFNLSWLRAFLRQAAEASAAEPAAEPTAEDVQATLLQLSARATAAAIKEHAAEAEEVIVCGGGVHNPALLAALQACLPGTEIQSSARHGLDPDAVEAVTFAWLARQRLAGLPGNLPAVTGATRPVLLGAVYQP